MNWFSENKVFSSFLVIIALAILALGYLTFSESGKYTEAAQNYQSEISKLAGLRGLAPYRNADNLKKIQEQAANYKGLVDGVRDQLIERQGAILPVEPAVFQARLRDLVSKTIDHANQRDVKLPPKFYLGFEKYENELPRNDVTSLLNWQLTAVESIINRLIDLKVTEIKPILRSALPGELNAEAPVKEIPLLKKYPFIVGFLGYPGNLQSILNDLDSLSQFTIVRAVKVENEEPKSPLKAGTVAPPADPAIPAEAPVDKIILGKEKVTGSIIVDLVQFTPKQAPKK